MPELRRWWPWIALTVFPLALFFAIDGGLVTDPSWRVPNGHFFVVTLTALVTFFVAGLLVVAASQLRDARVVFLSLAFMAIAGIFVVHGLTTPGALIEGMNTWVGFSARLSLFTGAIFFALSTLGSRPRLHAFVVARQRIITAGFMIGLLAYASLAMADASGALGSSPAAAATETGQLAGYGEYGGYGSYSSDSSAGQAHEHGNSTMPGGHFGFLSSDGVSLAVTLATLSMLALVIAHYARLYRLVPTPLVAGFLGSGILLFQSQIIMYRGQTWNASWWLYHVLLLAAFTGSVTGLLVEYRQRGTVGSAVAGLLTHDTLEQLQAGYTDVIVALVAAVEAKDEYTRGHTQRVTSLAVKIGEEMRLPLSQLRVIAQAAMLHDIGKIAVPDSILNKPGSLSADEFAIVKRHPARGYEILAGVRSLHAELAGVRYHHEKLDGSGYPDGLSGEQIPLIARIITVADMYDALTSARSYRPAWTEQEALSLIQSEAGTKLDAACVAALKRVVTAADPVAAPQRSAATAEHARLEHARLPTSSPRHI